MSNTLFALLDANNFFVSCERMVEPALRNVPVAVLSSNDGCIIARSDEVKALGIPMGAPVFKMRDIIKAHNIQLISADFRLYRDISAFMMRYLKNRFPTVEIYSVDEAFIDLSDMGRFFDLPAYLAQTRQELWEQYALPVSIGVAPTKALAKIANKKAKKAKTTYLSFLTEPDAIQEALQNTKVEDVWGIGRRIAAKLQKMGITTAAQFTAMPAYTVRHYFHLPGLRLHEELNGKSVIDFHTDHAANKTILVSRTFGKDVYELQVLEAAMAWFISSAIARLQDQQLAAKAITVFVRTNPFRNVPQYRNDIVLAFPKATDYPPQLLELGLQGLHTLFKAGFGYKRMGITLLDLQPNTAIQPDLYDGAHLARRKQVQAAVRAVNSVWGRETVRWSSFHRFEHITEWKPIKAYATKENRNPDFLRSLTPEERSKARLWYNMRDFGAPTLPDPQPKR